MKTSSDPRGNRLLAALPNAQWLRWLPLLEPAEMALGQVTDTTRWTSSCAAGCC